MAKRFRRLKENFTCGKCGFKVKGDGYTNHCPDCLWSKHVDVNPGDRQAGCGGMMKPSDVGSKERGYIITHKCLKCGAEKNNKASPADNFDKIIRLGPLA